MIGTGESGRNQRENPHSLSPYFCEKKRTFFSTILAGKLKEATTKTTLAHSPTRERETERSLGEELSVG